MAGSRRGLRVVAANKGPAAPSHLRPATAEWWVEVLTTWELDSHHRHLLTLACEALDRAVQAREVIKRRGMTFRDRFRQPKMRPEVAIERHSWIAFARLLRELDLDIDGPPDARRTPRLHRSR